MSERSPLHRRRLRARKSVKTPTFISVDFFCGAGGTTRGLIDAGGYVVAGIDKDKRCEDTYVRNNHNTALDKATPKFLHRDIFPATKDYPSGEQKDLFAEVEAALDAAKALAPKAPVLFAICAPCQPFTKLSRKELSAKRKDGRRRDQNLLLEAAKFVERFLPDLVLSENVRGIGDPKYGTVWADFESKLVKLGYATAADVVCASRFGVPQHRKRSILLAVRKHEGAGDAILLTVPESDPKAAVVTVKKALDGLPEIGAGEHSADDPNHRTRTLSTTNLARLRAAKPGQSNAYLDNFRNGKLKLPCHRKVNKRLGVPCFTDVYTRMNPDRPSPTITTKCHSISNGRFGHFDTSQVRGISLREAAILQSFPRTYVFYPTEQIEPIARMIGNAVPPLLAKFYSRHLVSIYRRDRKRRATA